MILEKLNKTVNLNKITLEHWTELPRSKWGAEGGRTWRKSGSRGGASNHWDSGTDLMGVHQGQLDWECWSMWSKWTLWTWLAMTADWEVKDNGTGFLFYCMDWFCGSLVCLDTHLYRPDGGGRTLDFPWGREPWLLLGLEREGEVERERKRESRRRWKFLINE